VLRKVPFKDGEKLFKARKLFLKAIFSIEKIEEKLN
jgi:hypothetical protein